MTVEYALTRTEIVRGFFRSLSISPKFRATILLNLTFIAALVLLLRIALSGSFKTWDALVAVAWALGALAFLPLGCSFGERRKNEPSRYRPTVSALKLGRFERRFGGTRSSWSRMRDSSSSSPSAVETHSSYQFEHFHHSTTATYSSLRLNAGRKPASEARGKCGR